MKRETAGQKLFQNSYKSSFYSSIHQDPSKIDFPKEIPIRRVDRMIKKPLIVIHLQNTLKQGTVAELEIDFNGQIWESSEGMFKGSYPENTGEKRWRNFT